jgi:hypothetical protein
VRTRTPAHLKWLLNERAAVAGALRSLAVREAELQGLLGAIARQREIRERELAALTHALAYFERKCAARPLGTAPVRAHQGRYGERGGLGEFLLGMLQASAPQALDTVTLTERIVERFGVAFATARERERFIANSVRPALRRLQAKGLVEPLGAVRPGAGQWRVTHWPMTLGSLGHGAGLERAAESSPLPLSC